MDTLYLQEMMQGEFSKKENRPIKTKEEKNRFDLALEKQIDSYVEAMEFEDDPNHRDLLPPKLRREKIKIELKAVAKSLEIPDLLESAVKILLSEGATYLSEEIYARLISDFSNSYSQISSMNWNQPNDVDMSTLIQLHNESLEGIAIIATDKFSKELYLECLSLFSLLSVLRPGHSEYWFRMGIAAQKFGNLALATTTYAAAAELDPKHIGARLFATECYIQLKLLSEAKIEFEAAKEIAHNFQVENMWLDLLPEFEDRLKP